MIKSKSRKTIAVIALGVLGALALAGAAQARTPGVPPVLCGYSFSPIDTASGGVQNAARDSTVNASKVKLRLRDDNDAANAGTSAEVGNLGLAVEAGDVLSVDYVLNNGASPAGGAARLFAYFTPDADTWGAAPDYVATASEASGTLLITFTSAGTIGTAGVVYDTSGGNFGQAVYTNLRLGELAVPFVTDECPAPPTRINRVPAPSVNQAPCDGLATLNVPDKEGVLYEVKIGDEWVVAQDQMAVPPGWLRVKATPLDGFYFKNDRDQVKTWKLKVYPSSQCPPASPSPDPSVSPSPDPSPSVSPSPSPDPSPSVSPSTSPEAGVPPIPAGTNLPETSGPRLFPMLMLAGLVLVGIGGTGIYLTRRKVEPTP